MVQRADAQLPERRRTLVSALFADDDVRYAYDRVRRPKGHLLV